MNDAQKRFWNSISLIFNGVKIVGGFVESAVPTGGVCAGVKKAAPGAGKFLGAIDGQVAIGSGCYAGICDIL